MREHPPMISTDARPDGSIDACASAAWMGTVRRSNSGALKALKSSRVRVMVKSRSFIKHSMLICASRTPDGDSVFLAFSHAAASLSLALGLVIGSTPCFSRNALATYWMTQSSKSRPPRLRS